MISAAQHHAPAVRVLALLALRPLSVSVRRCRDGEERDRVSGVPGT
jgi:hypothetical protein